ncbi:MAG: NnrU family protein [Casimicrobiaceae bacterium]
MAIMIAGLVLFIGVHLVPALPGLRRTLAANWSEDRYKKIFSVVAGIGLLLIVVGYYLGERGPQLFAGQPVARAAAPWVMMLVFILFAASHMRGHIRRLMQHPMVIGVLLWSGVHLLANGDRRGTLLFGTFLAWSVVDLIASLRRGPIAPFEPALRYDLMAAVGGVVVAGVVMLLHPYLFGVRPY